MIRLRNRLKIDSGQIFFGWWIVLGAFLMQVLNGGLFFQAFQVYFKHLETEFGWTKTQIAAAFTLSRAESGILGPFQGWLVDRFGTRRVMQIGVLLYAAGFFVYGNIQDIWQFYGAYLIISMGSSLGGFITVNAAIANWFDKKRSRAMGLASVGWGVSGWALPGIVYGMDILGWRGLAMWSGVLVLVVGLPLTLVFRHSPEPYGYLPDGERPQSGQRSEGNIPATARPILNLVSRGFTSREALKTPSFWFVSLGHASAMLAVSAINAQFIPYLESDLNMTAATGAWIFTVLTTVMIAAQLTTGFLAERIEMRKIIVVCMIGHTLALVILALAQTVPMLVAFAVVHGLSWGFRGPLMTAIRADYFGRSAFATIMGFSSLVVQLGTMSGPIVAAGIKDVVDSYTPAFWFMAFVTVAGAFFFAAARPPDPPRRLTGVPQEQIDRDREVSAAH